MKTPDLQPISASIAVLLSRPDVEVPSVLAIQRDDFSYIPSPGLWEVPGGGMEPEDQLQPLKCATRELSEELNVYVDEKSVVWSARYSICPGGYYTFHVAEVALSSVRTMRLGDEGQQCKIMPTATFLARPDAVLSHKRGLSNYFSYAASGTFFSGDALPYWWQFSPKPHLQNATTSAQRQ